LCFRDLPSILIPVPRGWKRRVLDLDDAIDFAYACDLETVSFGVHDRIGSRWKYNKKETDKAFDIDW
jgi:hypothetical protein